MTNHFKREAKLMLLIPLLLVFLGFVLALLVPKLGDDGNLRGRWKKSSDGKTYLSIVDDNGGHCGPLLVDGKPWPYKIGEPGPITPGRHTIECGAGLSFEIPEGVVFRFNYWGP